MLIIFLLIAKFSLSEGISPYFSFQLHYCRFQCVDPCEGTKEVDNPNGNNNNPTAFYWRDFYGPIPTDAYPLGNSLQNPQTYIGLAYDASKNGTFVTTIVEGLNYVYTVLNGNVTKISNHIQILCTNEPERLIWMKITSTNFPTLEDGLINVRGSIHNTKDGVVQHYITKTFKCQVLYAGFGREDLMEYVLLDGTNSSTDNFMFLMYRTEEIEKSEKKIKSKPFLSHLYDYSIRPNSIFPSFYKQINIGSCSIICTNEGKGKEGKLKSNKKSLASMAYYWKSDDIFNEHEALDVGFVNDTKLYLAQGYSSLYNWYDIGARRNNIFTVLDGENEGQTQDDYRNYQVLSTNHPDKFSWINTTSEEFEESDESTIIPGGETDNGTQIFVGRRADDNNAIYPGSIKVLPTGAAIFTFSGGPFTDFEYLKFMDSKKMS